MNPFEKLEDLNDQYHSVMEEIFQIEGIDDEKVEAKAEFAARANQVLLMMKQAASVIKPFYEV